MCLLYSYCKNADMVLKTCALDETTMVKAEMPIIACFIGVDEVPMVKADTLYRRNYSF